MANTTDPFAQSIHGTNPQFLIEKITRLKIYNCTYWKEQCFGLTSATLIDKAVALKYCGGVYGGNLKPTNFLCLVLKMLQLQPEKDIVLEYIKNEDFKYVRALGCFYLRLAGTAEEVYRYLEPLYNDYRKLSYRGVGGWELIHLDEFVDRLLVEELVCDIALPHIVKRLKLEELGTIKERKSVLDGDINEIIANTTFDTHIASISELNKTQKEKKKIDNENNNNSSNNNSSNNQLPVEDVAIKFDDDDEEEQDVAIKFDDDNDDDIPVPPSESVRQPDKTKPSDRDRDDEDRDRDRRRESSRDRDRDRRRDSRDRDRRRDSRDRDRRRDDSRDRDRRRRDRRSYSRSSSPPPSQRRRRSRSRSRSPVKEKVNKEKDRKVDNEMDYYASTTTVVAKNTEKERKASEKQFNKIFGKQNKGKEITTDKGTKVVITAPEGSVEYWNQIRESLGMKKLKE